MTDPDRTLSDTQRDRLRKRLAAARKDSGRPIIQRRNDGRTRFPLSFAQQQLWFLDRLTGHGYSIAMSVPLAGPLDEPALQRALDALVARHEILRTVFVTEDADLFQVVGTGGTIPLPVEDLSSFPPFEAASRAVVFRSEDAERPFDLAVGPLFRVRLLRFDAEQHELLLVVHHIICDGWGLGVFIRDLAALYAGFAGSQPVLLPELPIQYADYSAWQRQQLQGAERERLLAYWRPRVAGAPVVELPVDRVRQTTPTFHGASERITLPRDLAQGIRALGRETRATPFMTLLTAFEILLARHTGQSEIVIGTPVANRTRPEFEPLVGVFVNSLVIRTTVGASLTARELIARVRDVCLGAFEHQQAPFEMLVQAFAPERDVKLNPVFQLAFNLVDGSGVLQEAAGLRFGPLRGLSHVSRFDLEVHVAETTDTFIVDFLYRTELFEARRVAALLSQYVRVLEGMVAGPDRRVEALALMSAADEGAVLAGGRGRASGYPETGTVAERFAAQVARRPRAVALEAEGTSWTYAEVGAAAGRVAGVLRQAGVGPNVAVGVWLARGGPLWWTVAGILGAGGAYVPLDVTQPAARGARMWGDAGVRVVVTTAALARSVPAGPWRVVTLEEAATAAERGPETAEWGGGATADDLAYVVFTSGSTGAPKGVAVPHRAVLRLVWAPDYVALGPETVLGQAATAAFDAATFEVWGAWLHGGRLVVLPPAVVVAPAALGAAVRAQGVTTLFLTTALVHQIGREAPGALAGLETLLFGGEAVEARWIAAMQAAGGPRRIVHVYGPTEVTTFATWQAVGPVGAAATLPIGGPIVDTQAYVLDGSGALAPVGAVGELYLGGAGVAHGYLGGARRTAEQFVPDGVSGAAGGRVYRTGDLVRWTAPGTLGFVGRRDGQLKLRGHRIEVGEVEAALSSVAGVGAAVVVAAGTGADRRLVAYVVPTPGVPLRGAAVRAAVQEQLPAYMVPAAIEVVPALPLNANGKVDRAALPAPAPWREAPGPPGPSGDVAAQIAAVWRQVLQVETVGLEENFFDAGGHSLLLVRVQTGLEAALGQRVALVTLFQYPTIAALAEHLRGGAAPPEETPRAAAAGRRDAGIAVIGLAGRFPGAPDLATWWARLCAGDELLHRFSDAELAAAGVPAALRAHPQYVPVRGILDGVDQFDAGLFGYAPRDAALLDPQQRLLLECAWTALETAGYAPAARDAVTRIGVYAGTSANTYVGVASRDALAGVAPLQVLLASDKDFLATRVSYKLQLTGPSVTVQTACSTSLVAVHAACQALRAGECDLALAGGVSVTVPSAGYLYHPEGIASPDGHCRPFDAAAAGTVAGNGVGLVVLKPLAQARADGDRVHAVIRGTAINNDGADKVGFTAPSVTGQAAVVAAAVAAAGVEPASIGYVEAHGTGTALGDPIEVAALRQVFGEGAGAGTCGLGSVKGNIGHLDAAAGITGLIKTVLAVEHGVVPPSLHFTAPNPRIELGPFFVPTTLTPWPARPDTPRRAGVSAFGMGGTNAHVIVEEAPAGEAAGPGRTWQVLPVSGQTPAAAAAAATHLADRLEAREAEDVALADVAYTLQVGRAALPVRRVAVGRDRATVAAALRTGRDQAAPAGRRPLVWQFPGQGTPVVGQGAALQASEPVFRAELEACAAAVAPWLDGADLGRVLYPRAGAGAALDPVWTQVGVVALELSLAALWQAWGLRPTVVVGHSVGELAAAVVAGVLTREAALQLTVRRAQAMAQAPAGGMLAVGADVAAVTPWLGEGVAVAAINGPRQTVVAGAAAGLAAVAARLAAAGLPVQRLATQGAFHSALMGAVGAPLTAVAATLPHRAPQCAWVSSVTGARLDTVDAGYWGAQVTAPVQWQAAVATARMLAGAAPVWLEVGPGRTLTHLVRGGAGETAVASLGEADAAAAVARALGTLWTAGCPPDWRAYHAGARRQRVALPTYPFQRHRYWLEAAPASGPVPAAWTKQPDVAKWIYQPCWKQTPFPRSTMSTSGHCLLFADAGPVGDSLRTMLRDRGLVVTTVTPGSHESEEPDCQLSFDPGEIAQYQQLVERLAQTGRLPSHIVHAWGVTGGSPVSMVNVDRTGAWLNRGFYSLLFLVQALTTRSELNEVRITLVSDQVQSVAGDERVEPAKAAALGLARVISQEHPQLRCRSIDGDWSVGGEAALAPLVSEILADADEPIVAYRNGKRWVRTFEPIPASAADAPSIPAIAGGAYLITGGLGRVGLTLAGHLAATASVRLILVSRTSLPPRSEWNGWLADHDASDRCSRRIRAVLELEATGSSVELISADVADIDRMREGLAAAESRVGPVRGVIHAAGATTESEFAPVRELDRLACERHFAPKILGTRVMEALFEGRPLDFFVLTSSLASVLGGLRFGAYAAANAFMDAFATAASIKHGGRWTSILWDGWHFEESAAAAELVPTAMTASEGRDAFDRVLHGPALPAVLVSTTELAPRLIRADARLPEAHDTLPHPSLHPRPGLSAPYVAPRTDTEAAIARAWQDALGIGPLGADDNFFELGGDSLVAVHLMSALSRALKVTLSPRHLWESPTPSRLAIRVAVLQEQAGAITTAALSQALHDVQHLSDTEIERLLSDG